MEKVLTHSDFLSKANNKEKSFLLLYKHESEQSDCAYRNLGEAFKGKGNAGIYTADVTTVKDIHQNYGVNSVPALLVFENSRLTNVIKGCHESEFYKALTDNTLFRTRAKDETRATRRVTVYSTPTCSWCNTLKAWLHKNNITYTDIDISSDQRAAEDLVKRSGQQGVPQTDINGSIVVGFNQPRLKELLGI